MKKAMVFLVIGVSVFVILTGCMVRANPGTIYILDNNQPPRPILTDQVPPTGVVVEAQPALVVVETVPDVFYVSATPNMFFYSSLWWYYYGGFWYRSSSHRGPWVTIDVGSVPKHFHNIPEHHFQRAGPPPRYDNDHQGGGQGNHGDQGDRRDRGDRGDHQDNGKRGKK
jgi:hypothetical protein